MIESWELLIGLIVVGLFAVCLFIFWLVRPTRYRNQRFEDFPRFLGPWAEAINRGGRILIAPEQAGISRLAFRLIGRSERKSLRVTVPRRRSSETELRFQLDSIASQFDHVEVFEKSRSFEFRLPATASYTSLVASRAAEAAFRTLGCDGESTFTIYASSVDPDPNYELRIFEQAANSAPGFLKRWFEKRAEKIRNRLPKRRPPDGPAT